MGNVVELITKESVAPQTLPKEAQALLAKDGQLPKDLVSVDVFTHVCLNEAGKWDWYKECRGMRIPGQDGKAPYDKLPWMVLRFSRVDGESYGRGYVEEYIGDLKSDEGLSQAILEGAVASAKVVFLLNPNANGLTVRKVAEAPNGAILPGAEGDLVCVQAQKAADLGVAAQQIERLEARLSFAFLLNSSVQRNGERVTAEEIRYMAGELEDALGGLYSILAVEFQMPLVQRVIVQMTKAKKLKPLPKNLVRPIIVTGLEALSRGHEAARLKQFVLDFQSMVGPEVTAQVLETDEVARRLGSAYSLDIKGLVKTQDQMAALNQQAQQADMVKTLGPQAIKTGGDLMKAGQDPKQVMQGMQPQAQEPQ
jgi:hypothetical protein